MIKKILKNDAIFHIQEYGIDILPFHMQPLNFYIFELLEKI